MSQDQFKAFQEAAQADLALQEKLKVVTDPVAIVAIAKDAGFLISVEELQQGVVKVELSDKDLDGISGGRAGSTEGVIKGWRSAC